MFAGYAFTHNLLGVADKFYPLFAVFDPGEYQVAFRLLHDLWMIMFLTSHTIAFSAAFLAIVVRIPAVFVNIKGTKGKHLETFSANAG